MRSLRTDLGIATTPRLGQPTQNDLRHGFVMFVRNGTQQRIFEDVVSAFGKRSPGFNLDVVFLQEFLGFDLLAERMRLDLVHRRDDLVDAR